MFEFVSISFLELMKGEQTQQENMHIQVEYLNKLGPEVLFDLITSHLSVFIKKKNITKKLPLAFTFSFPVHQKSLTSGKLTRCTKGFKALKGSEGKDVVELLKEAVNKRVSCVCYVCTKHSHTYLRV